MPCFDRSMFALARRSFPIAALSIASLCTSAQATWSILIADTRTGEIVIGSATCVELINLQQSTPVLITGVGAVTAQSAVDQTGMNRQLIRDRLLQGLPLDAILEELSMSDAGHGNRQYGMINVVGETLTYSGVQNADWAGGQTGRIERGAPGYADDIVYSVQGNILSGGNVVQDAVDAILASDGDLPQMLMDAMQAAKTAGGDGRCSCSNNNPTGCGSPPPAPFKSADVGYMLGTRAGDTDAVRAIYPITAVAGGVGLLDLNNDGLTDVVVGDRDSDELMIFLNSSMPGDPLSSLLPGQTLSGPASGTVDIRTGDFDNDGDNELALVQSNPPRLTIYEADDLGGLVDPVSFDLLGAPASMAVGPMIFPGDDIAVAIADTQEVLFYGYENDAYIEFGSLALGFEPAGIEIAELINGHRDDLAVADINNDSVHVYEHGGELGFKAPMTIATLNAPIKLRSADMDLDGDNELLAQTSAGRRVQIFSLKNNAWGEWGSVATLGNGIGFDVGPMNPGNDYPDIATTYSGNNRNLQLQISDGAGGFSQQTRTRVGSAARSVLFHDMNNNGDLDIVVGNSGDDGLIILDNPRDHILPQPGRFAEGDYFLSLNVPNQRREDPDPVDQLQGLYDSWLADRAGRVDAVRTEVFGNGIAWPGSSMRYEILLRDLNGELVPITDPSTIVVETNGVAIVSAVVNDSPGRFSVELDVSDELGVFSISIRVNDGDRTVQLMPDPRLTITNSLADLNADGVCNFFDVAIFVNAITAWSPYADLSGDGSVNFHDVALFLSEYSACNP